MTPIENCNNKLCPMYHKIWIYNGGKYYYSCIICPIREKSNDSNKK
jgi:hypothetical protein